MVVGRERNPLEEVGVGASSADIDRVGGCPGWMITYLEDKQIRQSRAQKHAERHSYTKD